MGGRAPLTHGPVAPGWEALFYGSAPWVAFYTVLFFLSRTLAPMLFTHAAKLKPADRSYWAASFASVANCIIIVPMAWVACGEANLLSSDASFTATTPLSTLCCYAMVGYTFYDLLPLLYHRNEWSGVGMYLMHHVCSLASWGTSAATGYAHSIVVPVLLLEFTGPFVNLRWFLSTAGYKDTKLYIANGVIMFLSFFVLRVVFNWWIFITRFILQREAFFETPLSIQLLCGGLFPVNLALQLLWFQKILMGILALLSGKKSKAK